jgi:CHAT domain-containing protein
MFVVTRDRLRVVQTDFDPSALTARVRLLRDLWGRARSDWRIGLPASRSLHRTLIAPLLTDGLRGVTHLLIVPHGILGQLPFAALQDERTGRFLVQDVSLSYLPSAMALPNLAGRPESPAGWTAANGFAPFPVELPASDREVAAIRTHLAGTSIQLGRKASEAAVRAALAAEGPVHVATHGILNTRNPMFSRIELARSGSRSSRDDGRLEVHEILGLTIRSPLVFFSGCETGAGQEWSEDPLLGTGDQTLAQAVLAAGAREVISTLWRIDDQGAAAFADLFYRRLSSLGVTDAFATAQRTMSADGRFGNPYYWAGYTLSGSGRTGPESQDPGTASVSPKTGKQLSPITLRWRRQ